MSSAPTAGYVLTSDADGVGTWQSPSSGASGWSIEGNDLHSAVSGNVAIGELSPAAKLDVYDDSGADVLQVHTGTLDVIHAVADVKDAARAVEVGLVTGQ